MKFLTDDITFSFTNRTTEDFCEYKLYITKRNLSPAELREETPIYTGKIYAPVYRRVTVDVTDIIKQYRPESVIGYIGADSDSRLIADVWFSTAGYNGRQEVYFGYPLASQNYEANIPSERGVGIALLGEGVYKDRSEYKYVLYPKYPPIKCGLSIIATGLNNSSIVYTDYNDIHITDSDYNPISEEDGAEPAPDATFNVEVSMKDMYNFPMVGNLYIKTIYGNPGDTDEDFIKFAEFDCKLHRYYLQWQDRLGAIQCQPFDGKNIFSEDFSNQTIENFQGHRRNVTTTVTSKWELSTRYLTDEQLPIYESINVSPKLILFDSKLNKCYNVIATTKAYTEKTFKTNGKKCFNFTVNVQLDKNNLILN